PDCTSTSGKEGVHPHCRSSDSTPRYPLEYCFVERAFSSTQEWRFTFRLRPSRFGERSVAGYVIENPFYGKTGLLATKMRTDFDNFFLRLAANNRFLWLSLTDWIDDGDEIDRIDMFRLEAMWAGRIP